MEPITILPYFYPITKLHKSHVKSREIDRAGTELAQSWNKKSIQTPKSLVSLGEIVSPRFLHRTVISEEVTVLFL